MKNYLCKFKTENSMQCTFCKNYLKCRRIRAGDCFQINEQLAIDVYLVFPDYFDNLKNTAKKEAGLK